MLMQKQIYLIILLVTFSLQRVGCQFCGVGCSICNLSNTCQQCSKDFELDAQQGKCKYQLCQENLYWQIKQIPIEDPSIACQAVCDQGYWINDQLNICESIQQCSKSFISQNAVSSSEEIKNIVQFDQDRYLIFYSNYINLVYSSNGVLQRNIRFQSNTLFVIFFEGFFFYFNDDQTITKKSESNSIIETIQEQIGIFDNFTQLIKINNYGFLIAKQKQNISIITIRRVFNIQKTSLQSFYYSKNINLEPQEQMFVFNQILFISGLDGIKIIKLTEENSELIIINLTNGYICNQLQKFQISSASQFFNEESYILISNSLPSLIKINQSGCININLDEYPKNIFTIQSDKNQWLFANLKTKLIIFDYFLTKIQEISQTNTDLLLFSQSFQVSSSSTLLITLFTSQNLLIYSSMNNENQFQILKTQIIPPIKPKKFTIFWDKLQPNKFQVLCYYFNIFSFVINTSNSDLQVSDYLYLNGFSRKDNEFSQEIQSIDYNQQLISACSKEGYIQTWDASQIFRSQNFDQQLINNFGRCRKLKFFTSSSILVLLDSSIIRYNVISNTIEKQWNFNLANQINRFISIQSNYAALLFDSCLFIIDDQNNQVAQDCSIAFQDEIISVNFDQEYFIIIQKQLVLLSYQLDTSQQTPKLVSISTYDSDAAIQLVKIRNYPSKYLSNGIFEIAIVKANQKFQVFNEKLDLLNTVTNIPLETSIDISFIDSDPSDQYYFVLGTTIFKQSSFKYLVYAISKSQNTSQLCVQASTAFKLYPVFKNINPITNGVEYDIKVLPVLSYVTLIQSFKWNPKWATNIVVDVQILQGIFLVQLLIIKNNSFYITGDSKGILAINFTNQKYTNCLFQITNQDIQSSDFINQVQQSIELGLLFVIKSNINVFSIYTNDFIETIEILQSSAPIQRFLILKEYQSIISLKSNIIFLKNYILNKSYTFNQLSTISNFLVNNNSIYIFGSKIMQLNLNLEIVLSSSNDVSSNIPQSCQLIKQTLICKMANGQLDFYSTNNLALILTIISETLDSNYLFSIDYEQNQIYLFTSSIEIYTLDGNLQQKVKQSNGAIYEMQFFNDIIAYRTAGYLTICERSSFKLRGNIISPGGGVLIKFIFLQEYYHVVIFTTSIRFGQIFSYNLLTLESIMQYKNSYNQNDSSTVVDIIYDRDQNSILFIDSSGNFQGIDYSGQYQVTNLLKISEFSSSSAYGLSGFSVDLRLNSIFIYSPLSVYLLYYGDFNNSMDKLKNTKAFIYAEIKENLITEQDLDKSTFIVLGDQGILYKYYQFQQEYYYNFNENAIELQYNPQNQVLVVAFSNKLVVFLQITQQKVQLSTGWKETTKQITLGNKTFNKFICQNIFLTKDSIIWHYDFTTQTIVYQFSLKQYPVRITSQLISTKSNLLILGMSNGELIIYDLISNKEVVYDFQQFNNNKPINSSISFLKETQTEIWLCFSDSLGVYKINKLTRSITEILKLSSLNVYTIISDFSVSLFEVDEKYSRFYLSLTTEVVVRKYQYDKNPLALSYLLLSKRQWNRLVMSDNLLLFYSSAFILIYNRENLSLVNSIRRLNNFQYITDVSILQEKYLIVISQQRFEFFILPQDGGNAKLVDQVSANDPILMKFQIQSTQSIMQNGPSSKILFATILSKNQIVEQRYSLDYEESNDQTKHCQAPIEVKSYQQITTTLNQIKPQTYSDPTIRNILNNPSSSKFTFFMILLLNGDLNPINLVDSKDSSLAIFPISESIISEKAVNMRIYVDTFSNYQKEDLFLRDYSWSFQVENGGEINFSPKTQNIHIQNILIEDQDISNISFKFSNIRKAVFKGVHFKNTKMMVSTASNSQSFFNFDTCEELYIYDITVDNTLDDYLVFKSLLNAKSIKKLVLKNITINKSIVDTFINIQYIQMIHLENIQIFNCTFNQKPSMNQQSYFFALVGIQDALLATIVMRKCSNLCLIHTTNEYLNGNTKMKLKTDKITLFDLTIEENLIDYSVDQPIISLQNSHITLIQSQFSKNGGNIQIMNCVTVNILESQLFSNQNLNGGALNIFQCTQIISISKTQFDSNRAKASGGAIFIQEFYGDFNIDTSSTQVKNNIAQIGGGIRIVNKMQDQFDVTFWQNIKDSFSNNIAYIYGDNFATFLQNIKVSLYTIKNDLEEENEVPFIKSYRVQNQLTDAEKSLWNDIIELENFRSGSYLKLQLSLYDTEGRIFTFSQQKLEQNQYPDSIVQELSSIQFKLERSQQSHVSITGQDIITHQQYVDIIDKFVFQQTQVISLPNTQQQVQISYSLGAYQNVLHKPILIKLNFRTCITGEILKEISSSMYSCYQCPLGFFSLQDPTQDLFWKKIIEDKQTDSSQFIQKADCTKCPSSAVQCQSNIIQLKNGYWRESNYTTDIIECDSSFNACEGEDSESKNYCKYGYTGPICRECDWAGKVWEGKKFTRSVSNQLKCVECSQFSQQIIFILMTALVLIIYFLITIILFMNSFMHSQTCYYLRFLKLLPISKNSIRDQSSFYLKILINYIQISSILVSLQFSFFPDVFSYLPSFIGSPANQVIISINCVVSKESIMEISRIHILQIFQAIIPLFFFIVMFNLIKLAEIFKKFTVKQYHKFTMMNFLFVFFQPDQISFFSHQLTCSRVGSKLYVSSDLQIECNNSDYNKFAYSISFPLLFFWGALPLLIFYRLRQRSQTLNYCITKYQFGYFYTEFKPKFYYWEFIRIYLRVMIVVISTLLKEYTFINYQIAIFILYLYIKSTVYYSPINNIYLQKFDNLCYQIIILNSILSTINSSLQSKIIYGLIFVIHYTFILKIILVIILFKVNNPLTLIGKYVRAIFKKILLIKFDQHYSKHQELQKKALNYWKKLQKNLNLLIGKQAYNQITQIKQCVQNTQINNSQNTIQLSSVNQANNFYKKMLKAQLNQSSLNNSLKKSKHLQQIVDQTSFVDSICEKSDNKNSPSLENQFPKDCLFKLARSQTDCKENQFSVLKSQSMDQSSSQFSINKETELDHSQTRQINQRFSQLYETGFKLMRKNSSTYFPNQD